MTTENDNNGSSTQVFGEVDWTTPKATTFQKKEFPKVEWMNLKTGENQIRVVSPPFQRTGHQVRKDANDKFGQFVGCSVIHGSCVLCEKAKEDKALKLKSRWLIGVIDRKTGGYKILDVSWGAFGPIQNLAKSSWGDPTKYDIVINKAPPGTPPANYYSAIPQIPTLLSGSDQLIRDNPDHVEELKRRCVPPTIEQLKKRLDKIFGTDTSTDFNFGTNEKVVVKDEPETNDSSADNDEDAGFPAYQ